MAIKASDSITLARVDDGQDGEPTGVTESAMVPANPYSGMLWKNTGTPAGYLKNTVYRWNGSKWEIWTFSAVNIIAETFSGITFTGVTMEASKFVSKYSVSSDGRSYSGTMSIGDGAVINDYDSANDTGRFTVTRIGDLVNGRSHGGVSQQYELTPDGLALRSGDFNGILSAQALTKTPWINLAYGSGYAVAENNPLQYKIVYQPDGSRLIRFRGQFKRADNAAMAVNASLYPIGDATHTVPKEIFPERTEFGYAATGGGTGGRLAVNDSGMFIVTLYGAGSTYVSISGMQYIID